MLETIVSEAGIRRPFVVNSHAYFPEFRQMACLLSNLVIEAITTYVRQGKKVHLRYKQWEKNYETLLKQEHNLRHRMPETMVRAIKDELKPHYAHSDEEFFKPIPSNELWTIMQSTPLSEQLNSEEHVHCKRIADILKRIIIEKNLADKYKLIEPSYCTSQKF